MLPTLEPGDRVLVKRVSKNPSQLPAIGSVVVAWHPVKPNIRLIKRLGDAHESGLWLTGDNPEASTDSRQLGLIPRTNLIGVVVSVVSSRRSEHHR